MTRINMGLVILSVVCLLLQIVSAQNAHVYCNDHEFQYEEVINMNNDELGFRYSTDDPMNTKYSVKVYLQYLYVPWHYYRFHIYLCALYYIYHAYIFLGK